MSTIPSPALAGHSEARLSRGWTAGAWALVSLSLALTLRFLTAENVFAQEIWSVTGLRRLLIYAAAFGLWASAMRYFDVVTFTRLTAAGVLVFGIASVGPVPLIGAAAFLFGCYVLGRTLTASRVVALTAGLALAAFVLSFAVQVPINYSWSYAAAFVALLILQGRLTIQCAKEAYELWNLGADTSGKSRIFVEITAFLLIAHLLVTLQPEVSSDGLAMHLVIPMRIADQHFWDFPYQHTAWVVMPMTANWLYTGAYFFGGEYAARLLNFAVLLSLAGTVYQLSVRCASKRISAWATALFLSSPLVHHITGSLTVENFWTAFLLAGILAGLEGREREDSRSGLVCAMLLGSAASAKFGAVVPVIVAAALLARRRQGVSFAAILLLFALPPYVNAFLRTGNPVYPFFNSRFKSPYLAPNWDNLDIRFHQPMNWKLFRNLYFRTHLFMEARNGAVGFQYFTFLPLLLLTLRKRWPRTALVCFLVGATAFFATMAAASNARYIYPVFAMSAVLIAFTVERTRDSFGRLSRVLIASGLVLCSLNVYMLQAAGWYHPDFFLPLWNRREIGEYLDVHAPARALVDAVNRQAPGRPVAFFSTNAHAGLKGTAWTDTWHHWTFGKAMQEANSAKDVADWMRLHDIDWFVCRWDGEGIDWPYVQEYLSDNTRVVVRSGGYELRHREPPPPPSPLAAGTYDDASHSIRYKGKWARGDQFAEAMRSTVTYSNERDASASAEFVGESVVWVYTKASNRGKAEVMIDGRAVGTFDLYSATTMWKERAVFRDLGSGAHRLTIRVLGEKSPDASQTFVDIDALLVE